MAQGHRRRGTRLLVAVAVTAGVLSGIAPADATYVPETLGDRRPVQAGPAEPGFPIDYVGVLWEADGAHEDEDDALPEPHGAVRFRHDGRWGPWQPLIEDGAQVEGSWSSGLVSGGDAEAYQVRGIPADAIRAEAAAINTTDGPLVRTGEARAGAAGAIDSAKCQSRADWGADETLRFNSDGTEIWPPAFFPVQTTIVHHTATKNDDPDPEATVRAIYRYHAVDNGWGDIGYQYLVDESGVVYEGRWSGEASTSCETSGGTGVDFGHEAGTDQMVTGAHTGGANSGNLGISLLGTFTTKPRSGAEPKAAAVVSLEDVLAELMVRHGLDPEGTVDYVNPVDGTTKEGVPTISGHRDWGSTECPGERLYNQLPTIRSNVAAKMTTADLGPSVSITAPADGAKVNGDVTISASPSAEVDVVEFFVGSTLVGTDASPDGGWTASWDSTTVADGVHTITARAVDTATNEEATASVSVTVDNVADAEAHVADLDGSSASLRNQWQATVTITVHSGTTPLAGAAVAGSWSDGSSGTCTTGSTGTCSVVSARLGKGTKSTTFSVTGITKDGYAYDGTANSDPDGDSDGTTITVTKSA